MTLSPETAAELAAAFEQRWIAATLTSDAGALAALFAEDIVFLGSHPQMYVGQAALRGYLDSVPMGGPMTIAFSDRHVRVAGAEAFTTTSYVTFTTTPPGGGGSSFRWAISWTIGRAGEGWNILQHHASSRPVD